jgi:hypothetical protein
VKYRLSNINNIIKEVYMSKEEMRRSRRGSHSAAGYVAKELEEIRKLQETERGVDAEIITITEGCSAFFTLFCC